MVSERYKQKDAEIEEKKKEINNMKLQLNNMRDDINRTFRDVEAERADMMYRMRNREFLKEKLKADVIKIFGNYPKTDTNLKSMDKACEKLGKQGGKVFRCFNRETDRGKLYVGMPIHYLLKKKNGNIKLSRRRVIKKLDLENNMIELDEDVIIDLEEEIFIPA